MQTVFTAYFFDRNTEELNTNLDFFNICQTLIILVSELYKLVTMHKKYIRRSLTMSSFHFRCIYISDTCIECPTLKMLPYISRAIILWVNSITYWHMFSLSLLKLYVPSFELMMTVKKLLNVVRFLVQTIWVECFQF